MGLVGLVWFGFEHRVSGASASLGLVWFWFWYLLTTVVFCLEIDQNGFLGLVLGSFDGFQVVWVPKTQNWFWSFPHLKLETCPMDYL